MGMVELMERIVPKELFSHRPDGTVEERAQHLIDQCFPGATGMRLLKLGGEAAEAEIPYAQGNRALHGLMHGGCFFTVGDTLTAIMCMFYVERETQLMLTAGASIRYLRPARFDRVRAEARLKARAGNQLDFVCDFFNEEHKRAAQAKYRYVLAEAR